MKHILLLLLLAPCLLLAQNSEKANCDTLYKKGKQAQAKNDLPTALSCFAAVKECNPTKTTEIDSLIQATYDQINKELARSQKLLKNFISPQENAGWVYDPANNAFKVIDKDANDLTTAQYYQPDSFRNGVTIAKKLNDYVFVNSKGIESEESYDWLHYTNKHYYLGRNINGSGQVLSDSGRVLRDTFIDTYSDLNPIQRYLVNFSEETYKLMQKNELTMKAQYPNLTFPSNKYIRFLSENLWAIKDSLSELCIVKNEQGDVIIPVSALYSDIFPLDDHLFAVNLKGGYYEDFGMVVGGQWGIINAKGDRITPIKYSAITVIKNGRCMVNIGGFISSMGDFWEGKWGVIDLNGKEVIDTTYDKVMLYTDNVAFVGNDVVKLENGIEIEKKTKWGAIDTIGKVIIPFEYEYEYDTKKRPQNFQDEYALIYKDNKPYFIDKNGISTTRKCIETTSYFYKEDSLFLLDDGEYIGHISTIVDKNGKPVIPLKYNIIGNGIVDNVVLLEDKAQKKGVIYNVSSKRAIYHGYSTHYNYLGNKPSEGLIAVHDSDNRIGWIDLEGGRVIEPQKFNQAEGFREGLAAVSDSNGNWGFIDKEGEWVIKPQYREVRSFSEGFAAVSDSEDSWRFIDKNGKLINQIQYYHIGSDFSEGFALVYKNNDSTIEMIDTVGKPQTSLPFPIDEKFVNGRTMIHSKSQISNNMGYKSLNYGLIDKNGKTLLDQVPVSVAA